MEYPGTGTPPSPFAFPSHELGQPPTAERLPAAGGAPGRLLPPATRRSPPPVRTRPNPSCCTPPLTGRGCAPGSAGASGLHLAQRRRRDDDHRTGPRLDPPEATRTTTQSPHRRITMLVVQPAHVPRPKKEPRRQATRSRPLTSALTRRHESRPTSPQVVQRQPARRQPRPPTPRPPQSATAASIPMARPA